MSENIEKKQEELKNWITKIGMTPKYFIGLYCVENFYYEEDEEDIEIKRYYEKFKKEITRKTTKTEVLEKYFEFLYSLDEFKKAGYVKPFYVEDDSFDDEFNKRMKKISQEITNKLIEKENTI